MLSLALLSCLTIFAACEGEPRHTHLPPQKTTRAGEQRRAHPVTNGFVGTAGESSFYVELQHDRPESELQRPVLVEEDKRRREVGFAYLPGLVVMGFVDLDVVVVAGKFDVTCYDVGRHEKRWVSSFDTESLEVDGFVRRGSKLDVSLMGGATVTLDLETGRRSVP